MLVDELLKENDISFFKKTAEAQRDLPERTMVKIQMLIGGGVYPYLLEHVGDLTHRMATMPEVNYDRGYEFVKDKVEKTLRTLNSEYGFEREMHENFKNNFEYFKQNDKDFPYLTLNDFVDAIKNASKAYAEAHKKVPVFNFPQWLARQAAVSLGEMKFDVTRRILQQLKDLLDNKEEYIKQASEVIPNFRP